jgi:lanosterol synthase
VLQFEPKVTPLIESLRKEVFVGDWNAIDWPKARNFVSPVDLYRPHSWILDLSYVAMDAYESFLAPRLPWLRKRAIDWLAEVLEAEDRFTNSIDIGPVSKSMHVIIAWLRHGAESKQFKDHVERLRVRVMWRVCFCWKLSAYACVFVRSSRITCGWGEME